MEDHSLLREYFETHQGIGVLSTSDSKGNLGVALYARPHFMDQETIAFIMTDRQTHHNLQSNPKAAYLFKEKSSYTGKRLYLTKISEEKSNSLIAKLRRRKSYKAYKEYKEEATFLVCFRIDKVLPLIGIGD